MPVTVSVPVLVERENLSISAGIPPGDIVEFVPSVPSPNVVVGATGVTGEPVGITPAS